MTTIVYAQGILAADTRAYSGDKLPIGHKLKIHKLQDGTLYGVSSIQPGLSEVFSQWVEAGADLATLPTMLTDKPEFTALMIRPGNQVFFYHDDVRPSGPLLGGYFAIGSGAQYALGALAWGATAEEAVSVACELDPWSARPIVAYKAEPVAEEAPSPLHEALATTEAKAPPKRIEHLEIEAIRLRDRLVLIDGAIYAIEAFYDIEGDEVDDHRQAIACTITYDGEIVGISLADHQDATQH